jgi:hypothetical protein
MQARIDDALAECAVLEAVGWRELDTERFPDLALPGLTADGPSGGEAAAAINLAASRIRLALKPEAEP